MERPWPKLISSCSQLSGLRFHLIVISIGSIGALTGATAGRFRPIAQAISSFGKERMSGIHIKKFLEVTVVAMGAALVISNCCQEINRCSKVRPHGFQQGRSYCFVPPLNLAEKESHVCLNSRRNPISKCLAVSFENPKK